MKVSVNNSGLHFPPKRPAIFSFTSINFISQCHDIFILEEGFLFKSFHNFSCLFIPFILNMVFSVQFLFSANRPFSYSEKESQSNDTLLHFVEFSNVHNSDRSSNAIQSNFACKNV